MKGGGSGIEAAWRFGWLALALAGPAAAQDIERDPINYSTAPVNNSVTRLQQALDGGKKLAYDDKFGYLPAVLRELQVPESSQMLVFSKTSMQRQRITPRTPRAVYFSDDAYVGYCQQGGVIEVASVDPRLGSVFYTVEQHKGDRPVIQRQDDSCLICHASSQNQGFPGQLVRSLFVDASGEPILTLGTHRTDHSSPLKERWGGWYVTGTCGKQTHLGNLVLRGKNPAEPEDNAAGVNVTDLSPFLRTSDYLTPHSDIVALMVLEHQTGTHNRLTRANYLTRIALNERAELNKALGKPTDAPSESTDRRIKYACEPLVQYLLFSGETKLTDKIEGTSDFAKEFTRRGPRDERGRSLRDFDLKTRLFAYPCSYLVYSDAFDGLPEAAKEYVWHRLWDILNGKDQGADFAHLSAAGRRAVLEILLATKKDLPKYWRAAGT